MANHVQSLQKAMYVDIAGGVKAADTSLLTGDPDPNPWVFNFLTAILGSTLVSATR